MAQKRKKQLRWDECAHRTGTAAFQELEEKMASGVGDQPPTLPLLEGQKIYVLAMIVQVCRNTMAWVAGLEGHVDLSEAQKCEITPQGKYGNCYDCGSPFEHPAARILWTLGPDGKTGDLCCTCSERRMNAKKQ